MEFKVGKWYQGKGSTCYGKLTEKMGDFIFPSKEYVDVQGIFRNDGTYFSGKKWVLYAREVPLSEIQEYLPEDHPDKFPIIIEKEDNNHIIELLNKLRKK